MGMKLPSCNRGWQKGYFSMCRNLLARLASSMVWTQELGSVLGTAWVHLPERLPGKCWSFSGFEWSVRRSGGSMRSWEGKISSVRWLRAWRYGELEQSPLGRRNEKESQGGPGPWGEWKHPAGLVVCSHVRWKEILVKGRWHLEKYPQETLLFWQFGVDWSLGESRHERWGLRWKRVGGK